MYMNIIENDRDKEGMLFIYGANDDDINEQHHLFK